MSQDDNTYSVDMACRNCNWEGSIKVFKGSRVANQSCPRCDCKTLSNVFSPTWVRRLLKI